MESLSQQRKRIYKALSESVFFENGKPYCVDRKILLGRLTDKGERVITVEGRTIQFKRLLLFQLYGMYPNCSVLITHKDGDKDNNVIENLILNFTPEAKFL